MSSNLAGLNVYEKDQEFINECSAYCDHLNSILQGSPEFAKIGSYLPLKPETLLTKLRDGIVLAHVLEYIFPHTVAFERLSYKVNLEQLNQPKTKVIFEVTENLNVVVEAAKKAKLIVVNLGANDLLDMNSDLVLGLLWQIIRANLLAEVNLVSHPELIRLIQKGETLQTLLSLKSEQILLRWFNYHLKKAGSNKSIVNFSKDLSDGEAYGILLSQIAPKIVNRENIFQVLKESDHIKRAEIVLKEAEKLNCRYFVTPADIVSGHSRLNLGFIATLFNKNIGIKLPDEDELLLLYAELDDLRRKVKEYEEAIQINNDEIESTKNHHQAQLDLLNQEIEQFKYETVKKYEKEIENSVIKEKAKYEDALKKALDKEKSSKRSLEQQLKQLKSILSQCRKEDSFKKGDTINFSMPNDLDSLSKEVMELTKSVVTTNVELTANVEQLSNKIKQNDRLNHVMASKIREFSEMLIQEKKSGKQK
ncbi:Actinin-type, actin-binding domain-containing protein [Rozella allomycis CSF55]|uniref:Actinin-type, actin-binding domain-containing protein n=1 Tax=Rozella allomycis (strain CSF55) TaxID=988480 RepID=A0A075ANF6_ROZAC|nr:Actinin-type, actin-binding domain-containing protein [Rozella allomycis CSF55]|eukprot:EPZ31339.1 Actinin-type, actin-binding domain-containing protein [Rozella allomycis CSF55]